MSRRYDINEFVHRLRMSPGEYRYLGIGKSCLALTRKDYPGVVLLLEGIEPERLREGEDCHARVEALRKAEERGRARHVRAVQFAQRYDKLLEDVFHKTVDGRAYAHSTMISHTLLDLPVHFDLKESEGGQERRYTAKSVRLLKQIDGRALSYMEFENGKSPFFHEKRHAKNLAKDMAGWMHTLHTTGTDWALSQERDAATRERITSTFKKNAQGVTVPHRSDKVDFFMNRGMHELRWYLDRLKNGTPDFKSNLRARVNRSGGDVLLAQKLYEILAARLPNLLSQDRRVLAHTDLHPGNLIVGTGAEPRLRGVCDWMSAGYDYRAADFAGLGMARGLLPKTLEQYRKHEALNGVPEDQRVNPEAVYAIATARILFSYIQCLKNQYGGAISSQLMWRQVRELVGELQKVEPRIYGNIAYEIYQKPRGRLDSPAGMPRSNEGLDAA